MAFELKINRFPSNLSHWLLYSSALDLSQNMCNAESGKGTQDNRLQQSGSDGLSMTLDRPSKGSRKTQLNPSSVRPKLSSYPPVLGYLATLRRSKSSKQLCQQAVNLDKAVNETENDRTSLALENQSLTDRSAVRKLSGLFTKNPGAALQRDPTTMTAAKIKNKLSAAAPGFIKTALFRSRSKDSFLDTSFQETSIETPWQHKSSVPCYVGWRPPMPLPKNCPTTETPKRHHCTGTSVRRVLRSESRRSNLAWRKYSSESDLLDPSESGYMAIDRATMIPSWPPTLALLTPAVGRVIDDDAESLPYSRAVDVEDPSITSRTLPRKFRSDWFHSSSPSLRVQFNLEHEQREDAIQLDRTRSPVLKKKYSSLARTSGQRRVQSELEDQSRRFKRRLLTDESDSYRLSKSSDQRCEPWYDLWAADPSVRLCEIAQL